MRTRTLSALTWPEVRAAIDGGTGIVLPVGSTEQHGHHLPLSTDAVLASELALAVSEACDLVAAPALSYGYRSRPLSGGGEGFAGTTSLGAATFISLCEDVLRAFVRDGWRRIVLLNWHYENQNFVYEAAWRALEPHEEMTAKILVMEAPFSELSDESMTVLFPEGFPGWDVEHASIMETAMMYVLRPELVRRDRVVDDQARRHPTWDVIPAPDDFIPKSGVLWHPSEATEEIGRRFVKAAVDRLEEALRTEFGL
jgi:creatinine amidohydrolase